MLFLIPYKLGFQSSTKLNPDPDQNNMDPLRGTAENTNDALFFVPDPGHA